MEPCLKDSDVSWMLISTVLVLSMFPGLAFFEAGLLRHKSTTTIIAQVFVGLSMLSAMWFLFGFSLTFSGSNGFIGDFSDAMFITTSFEDCMPGMTIPTPLYALFQLMFASITPLLMTGAFAERMTWPAFIAFTALWELLVYYPVAHWMWSPHGWLAKRGALDFAGGIVIHTTAGTSSLVAVLFLGRRIGFDKYHHGEFPYSSLTTAAVGATLLWTGWFGFNGGSALAANASAVHAVFNSQLGASFAALTFVLVTFWRTGRPSTIATLNGAIAGLAGVTPASGYITPPAAMLLGILLGLSIQPGVHLLKARFRVDDALDVSVVHGLTGVIGSVYVGFAATHWVYPGSKYEGVVATHGESWALLGEQILAVFVCGLWAAAFSAIILFAISRFTPLRVPSEDEACGLDHAIFAERCLRIHHEDGLGGSFLGTTNDTLHVARIAANYSDPLREDESVARLRHDVAPMSTESREASITAGAAPTAVASS